MQCVILFTQTESIAIAFSLQKEHLARCAVLYKHTHTKTALLAQVGALPESTKDSNREKSLAQGQHGGVFGPTLFGIQSLIHTSLLLCFSLFFFFWSSDLNLVYMNTLVGEQACIKICSNWPEGA